MLTFASQTNIAGYSRELLRNFPANSEQPRGVRITSQKNPRVRKIRVRNSGAGNGCANFMDTWKKCALSAGKPMSIKFRVLEGGLGGGKADFIFMGARIFLNQSDSGVLNSNRIAHRGGIAQSGPPGLGRMGGRFRPSRGVSPSHRAPKSPEQGSPGDFCPWCQCFRPVLRPRRPATEWRHGEMQIWLGRMLERLREHLNRSLVLSGTELRIARFPELRAWSRQKVHSEKQKTSRIAIK